jgi:GNAT superfamily N-acetyltransferase
VTVAVRPARGKDDLAAVRALCRDYRQHLIDHAPQSRPVIGHFDPVDANAALIAEIATHHARPQGGITQAQAGDAVIGCGMYSGDALDAVELKRNYVAADGRGIGAARAIRSTLIAQARTNGFARVRLDTLHRLTAAHRLYDRSGFARRDAYFDLPAVAVPHVRFYERAT